MKWFLESAGQSREAELDQAGLRKLWENKDD